MRVATSDGLEQLIIMGKGALRMTAQELYGEVMRSEKEIDAILSEMKSKNKGTYTICGKITQNS